MIWHFPKIQTTRNEQEQAQKVIDEVNEFLESPSDEECIDIIHAVETLIRIRFDDRQYEIDDVMKQTIQKNSDRGYYCKQCY